MTSPSQSPTLRHGNANSRLPQPDRSEAPTSLPMPASSFAEPSPKSFIGTRVPRQHQSNGDVFGRSLEHVVHHRRRPLLPTSRWTT